MKLLWILLSFIAINATAMATDAKVMNHAENYVLAACPGAKSAAITDAKLADQTVKKEGSVYTYDLTLKTDLNVYVTLRVVKDESEGNTQVISDAYLPKGCNAETTVQTVECGDHWFNAEFKIDFATNRATVLLGGDSVRGSKELGGKVQYLPQNEDGLTLEVQTREGGEVATYNLQSKNAFGQWNAEKDGIYLGYCN